MSSLKEKLSDIVESVLDAFNLSSNAIEKIISENKDFLKAERKTAEESEEGILALKDYAVNETPKLKEAMLTLADVYEQIYDNRIKRVEQLSLEFITPLEELLVGFEKKKDELEDAQKAKKNLEKARKKLEKEESRPEEKKKPDKLEHAKEMYAEAERTYNKEESEAKIAKEVFQKEKTETMKKVLNSIIDIEETYHKSILDSLKNLKAKASQIDTAKEPKSTEKPEETTEEESEAESQE